MTTWLRYTCHNCKWNCSSTRQHHQNSLKFQWTTCFLPFSPFFSSLLYFPSYFHLALLPLLLQHITEQLVVSITPPCANFDMFYAPIIQNWRGTDKQYSPHQLSMLFWFLKTRYPSGMPSHNLLNTHWPYYFSKFSATHFLAMSLVSVPHGYL